MAAGEEARCVLRYAQQVGQGLFTHDDVQRLLHQREPLPLAKPEHHSGGFPDGTALYPPPRARQPRAAVRA